MWVEQPKGGGGASGGVLLMWGKKVVEKLEFTLVCSF